MSSAATTYVAIDDETGRTTTVRLFTPEATAELGRELTERVEVARGLRHRSIVPIVTTGTENVEGRPCFFVVSERPAGGTLQDMLDRGRTLTASQAVVVGVEICRALDRAHRIGVIHLDIRPSAIAFGENHEVSLADLGVTTLVAERAWQSPSDVSMERARYSSPEQAAGRAFDEKSDVYALALVLAEAVTGAVPRLKTVDAIPSPLGKKEKYPPGCRAYSLTAPSPRAGGMPRPCS